MDPKHITLKQVDIFYKLTTIQLEMISHITQERVFEPGEMVFCEGADSDELYVISQGEIDIQVNPTRLRSMTTSLPGPVTIATLRRGQSFGEMALLDEGFRSATARVAGVRTVLLVIDRAKLMSLCEAYPQLGYRLMHNLAIDLALKLRSTDLKIREEVLYRPRSS